MSTHRNAAWPAIAGLTLLVSAFASTASQPEHKASARQLVESFARDSKAPGLAVSVGCAGELFWSYGTGYADLEQRVAVRPSSSKFRVGSVAKPFTAFALATLIEDKRIELDAEVQQYVPSFPRKEHAISVRQLAGHLAGIRHYENDEAYLRTHFPSVQAGLEIFQDAPLVMVPGERWAYSSYGYNLLSAAMESAAETPFLELMDEVVFDPIGMHDTVADELSKIIANRVRYYRFTDNGYANEPEVDNSYKWASGGFLSTTDDMVRFGLAHLDDTHLKAETIADLWAPMTTNDGEPTGYGIGWRIVADEDGFLWHGHGGGSIGGTTQFWLFPDHGLVLTAASNVTELNYGLFMVELRDHFLGLPECSIQR